MKRAVFLVILGQLLSGCGDDDDRPDSELLDISQPDTCVPACVDKQCGDDGCGGSCGVCLDGTQCENAHCVCVPEDSLICCGSALCWIDTCGVQGAQVTECMNGCSESKCLDCEPDCIGKQCGGDDCGGSCGACELGYVCQGSSCVPDCTADCTYGQTRCAGGASSECGSYDSDPCLDWGPSQSCAEWEECRNDACAVRLSSLWDVAVYDAEIFSGREWDTAASPPDPYVFVRVGEQSGESRVVADSYTPLWNQILLRNVSAANLLTKMGFQVWDEDAVVDDIVDPADSGKICNFTPGEVNLQTGEVTLSGCDAWLLRIQFLFAPAGTW